METAATADPTTRSSGENGTQGTSPGSGSTTKAVAADSPRGPVTYYVFEALKAAPFSKGDTLVYVDRVEAEDKAAARWAVVDKDPELQKRVSDEEGGVWLLAVAVRNGSPELTIEEVVKNVVRR